MELMSYAGGKILDIIGEEVFGFDSIDYGRLHHNLNLIRLQIISMRIAALAKKLNIKYEDLVDEENLIKIDKKIESLYKYIKKNISSEEHQNKLIELLHNMKYW